MGSSEYKFLPVETKLSCCSIKCTSFGMCAFKFCYLEESHTILLSDRVSAKGIPSKDGITGLSASWLVCGLAEGTANHGPSAEPDPLPVFVHPLS